MPIISVFYGIIITINFNDHNPPHFHAKYAEFEALIDIKSGSIMGGRLPPKARALTEEWRLLNQEQIMQCWDLIRESGQFFKIRGLDD